MFDKLIFAESCVACILRKEVVLTKNDEVSP